MGSSMAATFFAEQWTHRTLFIENHVVVNGCKWNVA